MRAFTTVIGALALVYFGRELGPAVLGRYFLFLAIASVTGLVAGFAGKMGQAKRMNEGERPHEYASAGLVLRIAASVPVLLALFLFRGSIDRYVGAPIALFLGGYLVVQQCYEWVDSVLYGFDRIPQRSVVHTGMEGGRVAVQSVLVFLGYQLQGLLIGVLSGAVVASIVGLYVAPISLRRPALSTVVDLAEFTLYLLGTDVSGRIFEWIDTLLIGVFLGPEAVGVYEVAWRVSRLLLLPADALTVPLLPELTDTLAPSGRTRTIELAYLGAVTLPIGVFAGSIVTGERVLQAVFGPEFATGYAVLVVLLLVSVVGSIETVGTTTLVALDRERLLFALSLVRSVLNVVATVVLIPLLGIEGASLATLIAASFQAVTSIVGIREFVTRPFPLAELAVLSGSGVGMLSILSLLPDLPLVVTIVVGAIVYTGIVGPVAVRYVRKNSGSSDLPFDA